MQDTLDQLHAFIEAVHAHPMVHVRVEQTRGATEKQLAAFEKVWGLPAELRAVFAHGGMRITLASDADFQTVWGELRLGGLSEVRGIQRRLRSNLKHDAESENWLRAIEAAHGIVVANADPFLVVDTRNGRVSRRSVKPFYDSEWVADSLAELVEHWIAAGGFTGHKQANQAEFDDWWSRVRECVPLHIPFQENRWLRHLSRFYAQNDLLGLSAAEQTAERVHGYVPASSRPSAGVPSALSDALAAGPADDEVWQVVADWNAAATGTCDDAPTVRTSWAEHVARDNFGTVATVRLGGVPHRFRWIAPGRFQMGSPSRERGRYHHEYLHQVTLTHGFWVGEAPVTQLQWFAVMGARSNSPAMRDQAADRISWHAAQRFIQAANSQTAFELGLPTEAQWEYACRADTQTPRYATALKTIAWYYANSRHTPRRVGTRQPNPWGLHDMLGLVREWCADWFGTDVPPKAVVDPSGPPQGTRRVNRGGDAHDDAEDLRAAARNGADPDANSCEYGFRLVASLGA